MAGFASESEGLLLLFVSQRQPGSYVGRQRLKRTMLILSIARALTPSAKSTPVAQLSSPLAI